MKTSCAISFGKNALAIRDDVSSTSMINGGLQSFGDINALFSDDVPSAPYATFEPNFWLLDGNYKIAPSSNAKGGWVSTAMSPGTGDFSFAAPEPELQINFNSVYSTNGLTFVFSPNSGDYIDRFRVTFYNASLVTIRQDIYYPTGTTFFTDQPVADFKRVQIKIYSTNRASRYARISRIDFDDITRFTGEQVKKANIVEEVNLLSTELSVNTLEFSLFSEDVNFSVVQPTGIYATLQYKEPIDVHADLGGETIYMGRYYLDEWESLSENLAEFKASDAIGLLNNEYFPEAGGFPPPYPAVPLDPISDGWSVDVVDLISDVMQQAGNINFSSDVSSETIKGWLPIKDCREILKRILFRIGAYATCSRSNAVEIKYFQLASNLSSTFDFIITLAEQGMNPLLQLKPLMTSVQVLSHDYIDDGKAVSYVIDFTTTIAETFIAKFDFPLCRITSIEGVNVLKNGTTWFELEDTTPGRVAFQASTYIDSKKIERINASVPANTTSNNISITDATLVDVANVKTVTQRVFDYYAQRYMVKVKLFAHPITAGNSVLMDTQSGKQIKGIAEKVEIDLANGFISNVEIVGVLA